jgi:hypothetical protein
VLLASFRILSIVAGDISENKFFTCDTRAKNYNRRNFMHNLEVPRIDLERVENEPIEENVEENKYNKLMSASNTPRLPSNLLDSNLLHLILSNYSGPRDKNGLFTGIGEVSFAHTADEELYEMFFKRKEEDIHERNFYDDDYGEEEEHHEDLQITPATPDDDIPEYRFDYRGEFSHGYLHGNGTLAWNDGIKYRGEFQENIINGEGQFTYPDGSYYQGGVRDGLRHGKGCFVNSSTGATYEGDWVAGERSGMGKLIYQPENSFTQTLAEYYEGEFKHSARHGHGTMNYRSGNYYIGEWRSNEKNGHGIMYWTLNGNEKYEGDWLNGLQHGNGVHIFFNIKQGTCNYYEGEFHEGLRSGYGTFYYADGSKYEGEWRDNVKHGIGEYSFANGTIQRGVFENDKIISIVEIEGQTRSDDAQDSTTTIPEKLTNEARSMTNIPLYIEDLVLHSGHVDDVMQIQHVVARQAPKLRQIFQYYSKFGLAPELVRVNTNAEPGEMQTLRRLESFSPMPNQQVSLSLTASGNSKKIELKDFKFVVAKAGEINMTQFWKFATDCSLIAPDHLTCAKIDRIFITAKNRKGKLMNTPTSTNILTITGEANDENADQPKRGNILEPLQQGKHTVHLHSADNKMRFREFVEAIVRIAACYFGDEESAQDFRVSERVNQLIEGVIFKRFDAISSKHQRESDALFLSQKQEFEQIINRNIHALQKLFMYYSDISSGGISLTTNKHNKILPSFVDDTTMTVRQFLRMLQLLGFINQSLPLHQVLSLFDNQEEEDDSLDVSMNNPHEGLASPTTSVRTTSTKQQPTMRVFPAPRPVHSSFKIEKKSVAPNLIVEREIIFNEFVEALIKCAINRAGNKDKKEAEQLEQFLTQLLNKAKSEGIRFE